MSEPLPLEGHHPDHVAPACAAQRTVRVVQNRPMARDTYLLRLDDPEMAREIRPGQFLMLRPGPGPDPLLGRPFALYDVVRDGSGTPIGVDVVYLVMGRGTAELSRRREGDRVEVWGPLGNGFAPLKQSGPVAFVAGGIGQTPFLALGKWWTGKQAYGGERLSGAVASEVRMYYGTRSADLLAGVEDFREAGMAVRIATNDGSEGHRGYVTDLFAEDLKAGARPVKTAGCGPAPMLAILSRTIEEYGLDGDLSLENHMACGFGACFSCVAPIRQEDGSTDLRRVCVEGPIFPARDVVW